jgi:hypothetical protein
VNQIRVGIIKEEIVRIIGFNYKLLRIIIKWVK